MKKKIFVALSLLVLIALPSFVSQDVRDEFTHRFVSVQQPIIAIEASIQQRFALGPSIERGIVLGTSTVAAIPCRVTDVRIHLNSVPMLGSLLPISWMLEGDKCPSDGAASIWLGEENAKTVQAISYKVDPTSDEGIYTYQWKVGHLADGTPIKEGRNLLLFICPRGIINKRACSIPQLVIIQPSGK